MEDLKARMQQQTRFVLYTALEDQPLVPKPEWLFALKLVDSVVTYPAFIDKSHAIAFIRARKIDCIPVEISDIGSTLYPLAYSNKKIHLVLLDYEALLALEKGDFERVRQNVFEWTLVAP